MFIVIPCPETNVSHIIIDLLDMVKDKQIHIADTSAGDLVTVK